MLHLGLLALLAAGAAGPERTIVSPDGTLQVVIESPRGDATWRYGFHPTERTFARIEDTGSGRLIARPELGWNVVGATISPDSRTLTVLCLGYRSQHAEEELPREVAVVALATGAERGRVPLPYRFSELASPVPDPGGVQTPTHAFLASDDGRTVFVFAGRERPREGAPFTPELMVVDVASASLRARVALPLGTDAQCARLSPTRERILVPFAVGTVYNLLSIDTADGTIETVTLDAPSSFDLILAHDVELLFTSPNKHFWNEQPTRLTILDHEQPGWTLELPWYVEPARLSADGRRLALKGLGVFVLVDLATGRELRRQDGNRRFKRDVGFEEFLAGEPGFGPPPPPAPWPDPAPLSAWAETPYCPTVHGIERGVAR